MSPPIQEAMPCKATQDRWVMVESSDKMWFTREWNGKPLQHSYLENTMLYIAHFPEVESG